MAVATTDARERLVATAAGSGAPPDQLLNFLGAGYVPQPKQWEFHAACRQADLPDGPTQIAMGGPRGGSKSHALMAQVSLDDCQRYPGLYVLYLRKIGKAAREALEQLRQKTFAGLAHDYARQLGVIRFPNGSTIVVGHFKDDRDIDQYVGIEYDIIVVEEATQLSQQKLDLLFGSLRSTKPGWRARAYLGFNPGGIGHQYIRSRFVLPWRAGRERETRFIFISWEDNAFIEPEYVTYLDSLTGVLRRMWRDGDFDVGAGQFFTQWNYDTHVVRPFDVPAHWAMWGSMDYGWAHPTAVHWHVEDGDGNVYTIAEHVQSRWLPAQHAAALKAQMARLGRGAARLTFAAGHDAFAQKGDQEGKTVAEQYTEHGITLTPASIDRISGAAEMLGRLGNPEAGVAPSWYIFDTCARLVECIPGLQSDPNRPEDVLKVDADESGEGGDDPYDSARYGLMERRKRGIRLRRMAHGKARGWNP